MAERLTPAEENRVLRAEAEARERLFEISERMIAALREEVALLRAANQSELPLATPLFAHLCVGQCSDTERMLPEGHCPECGERVPGRGSAPC